MLHPNYIHHICIYWQLQALTCACDVCCFRWCCGYLSSYALTQLIRIVPCFILYCICLWVIWITTATIDTTCTCIRGQMDRDLHRNCGILYLCTRIFFPYLATFTTLLNTINSNCFLFFFLLAQFLRFHLCVRPNAE